MAEGRPKGTGTLRDEVARLQTPVVAGWAIALACFSAVPAGLLGIAAAGGWTVRAALALPLVVGTTARLFPGAASAILWASGAVGVLAVAGLALLAHAPLVPVVVLATSSVSFALAVHAMTMSDPPPRLRTAVVLALPIQVLATLGAGLLAAR